VVFNIAFAAALQPNQAADGADNPTKAAFLHTANVRKCLAGSFSRFPS